MHREVLSRFGFSKRADLMSVLPSVALPALGVFAGGLLGKRFLGGATADAISHSKDVGRLIGGITGGISGGLAREMLSNPAPQAPAYMPQGAPFDIDPTAEDIPPWALAGAQMIRPAIEAGKTAAVDRSHPEDMILGEIPGYSAVEGAREQGWRGALKGTAGTIAGGVGAGLLGYGLGRGIEGIAGRHLNVPLINMSLPELLTGFAGTIGATKGFRAGLGR